MVSQGSRVIAQELTNSGPIMKILGKKEHIFEWLQSPVINILRSLELTAPKQKVALRP